ncbi:MAG: glycosyltransferase family 9 protein [Burkholderiales bacterium]
MAARHFAAVADALAERGLRVVSAGSATESDIACEVLAAMRHRAVNLAQDISLGALAAVIASSRVHDTGVSNLAAALRIPSVIVFLASEVSRWAPLDRALHRLIIHPPICPSCGTTHACTVKAQTVIEQATRLLTTARCCPYHEPRLMQKTPPRSILPRIAPDCALLMSPRAANDRIRPITLVC